MVGIGVTCAPCTTIFEARDFHFHEPRRVGFTETGHSHLSDGDSRGLFSEVIQVGPGTCSAPINHLRMSLTYPCQGGVYRE